MFRVFASRPGLEVFGLRLRVQGLRLQLRPCERVRVDQGCNRVLPEFMGFRKVSVCLEIRFTELFGGGL